MTVGVVVSCYRQERFLPRTLAAIERALAGTDWRGVVEFALPPDGPLPGSARWQVVCAFDRATGRPGRPLRPGAGRMLGFERAGGDWVLFADSDIEVDAGWVRAALDTAQRRPEIAAIFGRIEEWFVDERGERPGLRRDMYGTGDRDRPVDYLAALALYRRDALAAVGGYDPRLHSDEDFELGVRFRQHGFEMLSLGRLGARHWSAPRPSFAELSRRWSTGICFGTGQALRLYLGRPGFGAQLRRQWLYVAMLGLAALGLAALADAIVTGSPRPLALWAALPLALLLAMIVKKRSVRLGALSLATWSVQAAGLVAGWFLLPRGARPLGTAPRPLGKVETLAC